MTNKPRRGGGVKALGVGTLKKELFFAASLTSSLIAPRHRSPLLLKNTKYSVMHSDRNSSKMDIFHGPTTYEPRVQTSSEQITTFVRHEYGRVGVFRNKIRSLVRNQFQLFPFDCITLNRRLISKACGNFVYVIYYKLNPSSYDGGGGTVRPPPPLFFLHFIKNIFRQPIPKNS